MGYMSAGPDQELQAGGKGSDDTEEPTRDLR
jgi:hypothetical protein